MDSNTLYKRLLKFGQDCFVLVKRLPSTKYNDVYGKQLIRSSSAPGAEYIEALEASSKKEFTHKLKRCRKEARESNHWISLIEFSNKEQKSTVLECSKLQSEATELIKIFAASILTSEKNREINK